MGFLLRMASRIVLFAAVFVAAVDAIRFVASSVLLLTPLRTLWVWAGGGPDGPAFLSGPGKDVFAAVFDVPAVAVLLGLSLVLWMAGYRRPQSLAPFALPEPR